MKFQKNFFQAFPLLLAFGLLFSCKKDESFSAFNASTAKQRFFKNVENADLATQKVADYLLVTLENPNKLQAYIENYGYPIWEKHFEAEKSNGTKSLIIPVKKPEDAQINAYIEAANDDNTPPPCNAPSKRI
jgi:hypothetical protein